MKKPWSGRFKGKTAKEVEGFTSSVSFDRRLWKYDIEGSVAHTKMLKKQKIISSRDADLILSGLNRIRRKIQGGKLKFNDSLEDVHMNIEHALMKEIGKTGGQLHTARSRNDQISLDLRLFLRDEIREIHVLLKNFQDVLLTLAEKYIDIVMPGYTHLQKAQPVLLSHHLLAYFEMFERDRERLKDCQKRVNVMPLGACALAGTTLPIDRKFTARQLKFPAITKNSLDTVSDRDFVVEFLSAASLIMVHLSRLAEELVLWSSEEFCFISLPDEFSTGSSMMPQKKNPDVLELIRGKTGRVYGHLISLFVILKGLPLSYNRDLQEDKEPLFDAVDTVKSCLTVLKAMMPRITFNKSKMERSAEHGFTNATELAEYLVRKGVPFREAHRITGRIVRYCIKKGKSLSNLELSRLKKFSTAIGKDVFSFLSLKSSVNLKKVYGGTAKKKVLDRLNEIKSER
jgi:argininosuccinate lyase